MVLILIRKASLNFSQLPLSSFLSITFVEGEDGVYEWSPGEVGMKGGGVLARASLGGSEMGG